MSPYKLEGDNLGQLSPKEREILAKRLDEVARAFKSEKSSPVLCEDCHERNLNTKSTIIGTEVKILCDRCDRNYRPFKTASAVI